MNAAELIATRQCTAGCLLATSRRHRCECVCGGRLHALLVGADLNVLIDIRGHDRCRLTDTEILQRAGASAW
jgi:hypothetical protein